MPRVVRCGLIQARNVKGPEAGLEAIKKAMVDKHVKLIEKAAKEKVRILCLQELFYGPYFCAEQETKWYHLTERIPEGPTTQLMMKLAKKHRMVIVVPVYEEDQPGVYYNTAAVIDADGKYLGKYRKTHIPHCKPGFWEKFYFRPGNLGYPVFETAYAQGRRLHLLRPPLPRGRARPRPQRRGDRLQPVGHGGGAVASTSGSWSSPRTRWPTATSWARSTASAPKRPGASASSTARATSATRAGSSWPKARATRTRVVVADLNLDLIEEVRSVWQFYRDRRPDAYAALVAP